MMAAFMKGATLDGGIGGDAGVLCINLRGRVSFGSATNPLDLGVNHGRTVVYDALITSASSTSRACSPSNEPHLPAHLVATMPATGCMSR